jgi:hypothetical protein
MPNNVLGYLSQTTNMATSAAFNSELYKDSNDLKKSFVLNKTYVTAV